MTDTRNPRGPASVDKVGAKAAFFEGLDRMLAADGHPVTPPPARPPPPPPPPALTFEAWAELSVRFRLTPQQDPTAELIARGIPLDVWWRLESQYRHAISEELRAGRRELAAIYDAKHNEEQARRGLSPQAPAASPPAASVASITTGGDRPSPSPRVIAPAALTGTTESPELAAAVREVGRMPFVPPPPSPAVPVKRPAKTVQSKVARPVGSETMPLDAGPLPRPTPTTPFAGSPGREAVVFVPPLNVWQYVALRAELMLMEGLPRQPTLTRYHVPTEAAFRALEEHWRHPDRRAELEAALGAFAVKVRTHVLQ